MGKFAVFLVLTLGFHYFYRVQNILNGRSLRGKKRQWRKPKRTKLKETEQEFLLNFVPFYKKLSQDKKELFDYKVLEFLSNVKIVGVKTSVTGEDKLLIACSAIIPIINFPTWKYNNLRVIFLHPRTMLIHGKKVLGLVGHGIMKDKMLLSKDALHFGFRYSDDKRHTALHEFMHLIDMADGEADGVPKLIMKRPEIVPWVQMMNAKLGKMVQPKASGETDLSRERAELLSNLTEYFFEKPEEFKEQEPDLYKEMEKMFNPSSE